MVGGMFFTDFFENMLWNDQNPQELELGPPQAGERRPRTYPARRKMPLATTVFAIRQIAFLWSGVLRSRKNSVMNHMNPAFLLSYPTQEPWEVSI